MRTLLLASVFFTSVAHHAQAEVFTVSMLGSDYAPSTISASVGDTIRFVNDDGSDHNVFVPTASHALDLGKQEVGTEVELVLRTPGTFEVECVFHDHMLLKVEVGS
jgi:plastocyanin